MRRTLIVTHQRKRGTTTKTDLPNGPSIGSRRVGPLLPRRSRGERRASSVAKTRTEGTAAASSERRGGYLGGAVTHPPSSSRLERRRVTRSTQCTRRERNSPGLFWVGATNRRSLPHTRVGSTPPPPSRSSSSPPKLITASTPVTCALCRSSCVAPSGVACVFDFLPKLFRYDEYYIIAWWYDDTCIWVSVTRASPNHVCGDCDVRMAWSGTAGRGRLHAVGGVDSRDARGHPSQKTSRPTIDRVIRCVVYDWTTA